MRKLLFLTLLVIGIGVARSQTWVDVEITPGECHTVIVTDEMYDHFEEWVELAKEEELNLEPLRRLRAVGLFNFGATLPAPYSRFFGVTFFDVGNAHFDEGTVVYVNTGMIPYYLPCYVNAVFYHEMCHAYIGVPGHVEKEPYMFQKGSEIDVETAIKMWDEGTKRELLQFLKKGNYKLFCN